MVKPRAMVPNMVTFGNLFLGFYSIILASQGKLIAASWLILIASVFDGLDGLVARLMRETSDFGGEVDSLSDIVSFGLAPSFLMYHIMLKQLGIFGLLLSFTLLCFGAVRLAKFNLLTDDLKPKGRYIGLPIPSTALTLTAYYLFARHNGNITVDPAILISLILILSFLMVSPIQYRRMPVVPIRNCKYPALSIGFLVLVFGVMFWKPGLTLFPIMALYIFTGPIEWGLIHSRQAQIEDEKENLE